MFQIIWCTTIFITSPLSHLKHAFNAILFFRWNVSRRTLETGGGPKYQKYNAFVITKACNNPNSIYYRTISCSCQNCSRGELVGCCNHPFVPPLNMSTLRFQEGTPEAPLQAPNATAVRDLLINLQQHHSESLPTFFCLGWVQNQQQPAVLMMSHLRIYKHSVLCHLLPPTDQLSTISLIQLLKNQMQFVLILLAIVHSFIQPNFLLATSWKSVSRRWIARTDPSSIQPKMNVILG